MEILKELLKRDIIYKEKDRELYYRIKDSLKDYKSFLTEKLGYDVIIRGDFIRILKLPGIAESFMGIREFTEVTEYVMFMELLIFLEDKGKEEQFLLSHISEFLSSNDLGQQYQWTDYSTRKMLIRVLKYAIKINLIKVNDGSEEGFVNDSSKEILFESTGISRYIVRTFPQDIDALASKEDIIEDKLESIDSDRGVLRRNRVYRRLLLSPIVYRQEVPEDYDYIKNFRNILEEDFRRYLDWQLHIHKNGALLVPADMERGIRLFPGSGALSDIILLITKEIYEQAKSGVLKRNEEDIIFMNKEHFEALILRLKEEKSRGFSKEYREMSDGRLIQEVIEEMESLFMLRELPDSLELLPLCGKVIGDYPKDFYEQQLCEGESNEG